MIEMQGIQRIYTSMMLDELAFAQECASTEAPSEADPLDLAADLEKVMVESGQLSPHEGSVSETETISFPVPAQAATLPQGEEPDAAAGHQPLQQQQQQQDHPTGGLLVKNA